MRAAWIESLQGSSCWICRRCGETQPWQSHQWSGLHEDVRNCKPIGEILERCRDFVELHRHCTDQAPK